MKRVILILVAAICSLLTVRATDNLVVPDITISQGGEGLIDIQLNNELPYVTFAFWLNLPEGINYVDMEVNEERFAPQAGQYLPIKEPSDDGRTISLGSLGITETPYAGNSGTLITVKFTADESLEMGTVLNATITGIKFSMNDDEKPFEDVAFTITIGEPDDGRIKFDENSSKLPPYTAGPKGNVRMTRTIKANQWSTIVLPFTLDKTKAETIFGSDVQLAEFSGFKVDYGEDDENVVPLGITINFSAYTMSARKSMTGGKPFLIKTSKDISSFEADDCSLAGAVTDVNKTDEFNTSGKFTGTFVKTKVPEDGLFISDEKFYYSTGATNIKAFRGWFELGAVLDKETDFSVKMYIGDIETKVEGISVRDAGGTIYDLSGRKMDKPQKSGIYIVNGKKVIMK